MLLYKEWNKRDLCVKGNKERAEVKRGQAGQASNKEKVEKNNALAKEHLHETISLIRPGIRRRKRTAGPREP